MDVKIKAMKLTDGSEVFDVDIFANGRGFDGGGGKRHLPGDRAKSIFSCTSAEHAAAFLQGLADLVEKHTVEELIDLKSGRPIEGIQARHAREERETKRSLARMNRNAKTVVCVSNDVNFGG